MKFNDKDAYCIKEIRSCVALNIPQEKSFSVICLAWNWEGETVLNMQHCALWVRNMYKVTPSASENLLMTQLL